MHLPKKRAGVAITRVQRILRASSRAPLTLFLIEPRSNFPHSLAAVVRRELDRVLDKRPQTSDWQRRPLTPDQEAYAALDVEVLVALRQTFP